MVRFISEDYDFARKGDGGLVQGYVTLKIPAKLAELIDKCIKETRAGYRSRAEFVKEAVRDKLEERC